MKRILSTAAVLAALAGSAFADPNLFDEAHQKCVEQPEVLTCSAVVEPMTIEDFVTSARADLQLVIERNGWTDLDPATTEIPSMSFFQFAAPKLNPESS